MPNILLIDDKEEALGELAHNLNLKLRNEDVEIRTWSPVGEEADAWTEFNDRVDSDTRLVVTDYDLTSRGQTGLFGSSIVGWCQQRAIPVGDYSKGNTLRLPEEPDLFEIRVPTGSDAAVGYVAAVYRGFVAIHEAIAQEAALLRERSPAAVLARILGVSEAENEFAQYTVRLGATSGALMARIVETADETQPNDEEKKRVLTYIVGHLLLCAILRFPGPILSERALQAYLATPDAATDDVRDLFLSARYHGPFKELDTYYWLSRVAAVVEPLLPETSTAETIGELNKLAISTQLGRKLTDHECPRCDGRNGGYICPFTDRIVCERTDCSVGSNGWIPPGAKLCRIERDFFDEWAPILGL
jgi:hypothetical protein